MSTLTDGERRLIVEILRKMKADRSPYVPTKYFKYIPNYKHHIKQLIKKELAFLYKAGNAVGLTQEGALLARQYINSY